MSVCAALWVCKGQWVARMKVSREDTQVCVCVCTDVCVANGLSQTIVLLISLRSHTPSHTQVLMLMNAKLLCQQKPRNNSEHAEHSMGFISPCVSLGISVTGCVSDEARAWWALEKTSLLLVSQIYA